MCVALLPRGHHVRPESVGARPLRGFGIKLFGFGHNCFGVQRGVGVQARAGMFNGARGTANLMGRGRQAQPCRRLRAKQMAQDIRQNLRVIFKPPDDQSAHPRTGKKPHHQFRPAQRSGVKPRNIGFKIT